MDNLGVIDTDRDRVSKAMSGLQSVFNSLGLELHATEINETYVEALGCVLEGDQMRSRTNPKRLWRIHHAIKALLRRGRRTGRTLEVLIGHCTFIGLMRRGSLAIFHSVYSFIHKHYKQVASLWSSIKLELKSFMGIMFLLVQDWWRPWNSAVTSSDSSLSGFGVSQAWWPKSVVSQVGRLQERSRFRRSGSHAARESALSSAGFHFDGQSWGPFSPDAAKRIAEAGWEVDEKFVEVPAFGFKREHWMPKLWGRCNFKESIGILEARAVLKAVRRLCMSSFGHDIRHLHLCDNLGVVLSIERSRSKNYKLLKVIRQINAYLFARNVNLAIPSELNFSDEPSRVFDDEESKLLFDLIQLDDFCGVSSQAPKQQLHAAAASSSFEPVSDTPFTGAKESGSISKPLSETGSGWEPARTEACSLKDSPAEWGRLFDQESGGQSHQSSEVDRSCRVESCGPSSVPCCGDGGGERQRKHLIRMEGRKRRKEASYLAKQTKRKSAEVGQLWNASGSPGPEFFGTGQRQPTRQGNYDKKWQELEELARPKRVSFTNPGQVDRMLVDLFNAKYFEGEGSHYGDYVMASLMDRKPDFGKLDHLKLSRAWRSMKCWRKLCPSRSRLAYPLAVWCGISWRMVELGHVQKAVFNLIQLSTYHRPGALLKLRKMGLVPPTSGATGFWSIVTSLTETSDVSKTGSKDPPGLKVASVPDANSQSALQRAQDGSGVEFQLCGIHDSVPTSLRRSEGGAHCPISGEALWTIDRQGFKGQRHGRSSKARAMDDQNECTAIREGGQTCSDMASSGSQCSDGLQVRREVSRGDHPRPRLSGHHSLFQNSNETWLLC